jgi:opacity protein-like surface antigen
MAKRLIVTLMLAALTAGAFGQAQSPRVKPPQRMSFRIMGGYEWPQGHAGFTEFWQPGPNADVQFLVGVSRGTWLGIDVDASAYWFRAGKFATEYPGLASQNKPVAHGFVGIVVRRDFTPGRRLGVYGGLESGLVLVTPAEHYADIAGVRKTYFRIPQSIHLGLGAFIGLEYLVNRRLAIDLEPRILYVHDNPDVGLVTAARAGLRFIW